MTSENEPARSKKHAGRHLPQPLLETSTLLEAKASLSGPALTPRFVRRDAVDRPSDAYVVGRLGRL